MSASPLGAPSGARSGPDTPRLGIGIVGAGRVGAVLGAALRDQGHAITGVTAVSEASRTRAAALLPGVPVLELAEVIERSELVILAVPDDQLAGLAHGIAETLAVPGGQVFVHVSGLHGTDVLRSLAERGSGVIALHPAMTFTGTAADLPRLIGCPAAITAHGAMEPIAQALALELGAEPVMIAEADRALYHAALSHGANHLVVLVDQARELLARIGIEDPGTMLRPLMTAALEESLRRGAAALTGPVRRADAGTVRAHLDAIDEAEAVQPHALLDRADAPPGAVAPDIAQTYRALARAAVARAGLDAGDAARIRAILDEPHAPTDPIPPQEQP